MSAPRPKSPRRQPGALAATGACAALLAVVGLQPSPNAQAAAEPAPTASAAQGPAGQVSPSLARLAAKAPHRSVDVIVQAGRGRSVDDAAAAVRAHGGTVGSELELIRAVQGRVSAADALAIARDAGVRAVTVNGAVESTGYTGSIVKERIATAYNKSIGSEDVWFNGDGRTGKGIGVAVLDSGIAGDHADFRRSATDKTSRVTASVLVNPEATTPKDTVGHGTHVAGLIAGNGANRPSTDPLDGRYVGVAPDANLINVKIADDQGRATVADVINGLQFVVDKRVALNIKVANLSLTSTEAQSYTIDPLAAAVEQAWFAGVTVVAASGNAGPDSVKSAPGNDPYAISVGGADDRGTKDLGDDVIAAWTSTGTTQDGFRKPEVMAPGARLFAPLAAGSQYAAETAAVKLGGQYVRLGGTSMAAGVVSGAAALLAEEHPEWGPDQIKGALIRKARDVPGTGTQIAVDDARGASGDDTVSNHGLKPSPFIVSSTGKLDYARMRFGSLSWDPASGAQLAAWGGTTYVCSCAQVIGLPESDPLRTRFGGADPTRMRFGSAESTRMRFGSVGWSTYFDR